MDRTGFDDVAHFTAGAALGSRETSRHVSNLINGR